MNSLPLELVEEILSHVPSPSVPSARLASRTFNLVLSRRCFPVLAAFASSSSSPESASEMLYRVLLEDPSRRSRAALWSPRCRVPDRLPVPESFLEALWVSLHPTGESWASLEGGPQHLTVEVLQAQLEQLGVKVEVTPETLRETMFRYALYLSYVSPVDANVAPHAWVFDFLLNQNQQVGPKLWGRMPSCKQPPAVAYVAQGVAGV